MLSYIPLLYSLRQKQKWLLNNYDKDYPSIYIYLSLYLFLNCLVFFRSAHKSSKKLLEQCQKLDKVWSHIFSSTITLNDNSDSWYRKVRDVIEKQQSGALWMSESKVFLITYNYLYIAYDIYIVCMWYWIQGYVKNSLNLDLKYFIYKFHFQVFYFLTLPF